jgi:hypothetical protein
MRVLTLAVICVVAALGQEIPVNYPTAHGHRFISMSFDNFQEHVFEVTDHGAAVKMKGIRLGQFLRAAGWARQARSEGESYQVRIEGRGHAATFDLSQVEPGSLNKLVILVRERDGKRVPWEDRPLLVVTDGEGAVIETIAGVISVRVF